MTPTKNRLLLHICCAPCAVYVFPLLQERFSVSGFFYNPNIQPQKEYVFRVKEIEKLAEKKKWSLHIGPYDMNEWFAAHFALRNEPERGKRCLSCFEFRLRKTFEFARDHGFDHVASTLSISPYKVTRQINEAGNLLSREFNVGFVAENFKKMNGFAKAREMAAAEGIKHQNYCGCVYSLVEKKLRLRRRGT